MSICPALWPDGLERPRLLLSRRPTVSQTQKLENSEPRRQSLHLTVPSEDGQSTGEQSDSLVCSALFLTSAGAARPGVEVQVVSAKGSTSRPAWIYRNLFHYPALCFTPALTWLLELNRCTGNCDQYWLGWPSIQLKKDKITKVRNKGCKYFKKE